MPAVQTTYLDNQPEAFEGSIVNTEPNNLISRQVETAAIPYGRAVKQGVGVNGVLAATAQADIFRGITVRDQSNAGDVADVVPVGESALIMERGVIWVKAGAACNVGTAAYMLADGRFTSTVGTNLAIPRAIFDSTQAVANGLVKLRLS
jgi:hypothetical protein